MRRVLPLLFVFFVVFLLRLTTSTLNLKDGDNVRIAARVSSGTVIFDDRQYLRVGRLKVYLPAYPRLYYGDRVVLEGTVRGNNLDKARIIKLIPANDPLSILRSKLLSVYRRSLPLDEYGLVAGVTLGSKEGISAEMWKKLTNTGTAHVVVASGMNVVLVGGFLVGLAVSLFRRRTAIAIAVVGIWVYSILCGLEAPIVRASIMGTISYLAQFVGRLNQSFRAVAISASIMLLVYPRWIYDVGFFLSFFATISLIVFYNRVSLLTSRLAFIERLPRVFKDSLDTTISAQIGVMPVLFFTFGNFNLLSVIINSIVLWSIAPLTIIGYVGGIVGILTFPVGRMILLVGYPLARFFTFVVDIFA